MEFLEQRKFSWIKEDSLVGFFDTCLTELIRNGNATLSSADQSTDSNHECFQEVKAVAKYVASDMLTKDQFTRYGSWMKSETRDAIYNCILEKRKEIRKFMLKEKLASFPHLTDFDYNVKLAIASSNVLNLNEPLLSLFLHAKNADGKTQTFHFEMTTDEVKHLIDVLSDAHRCILDVNTS